MNQNRMEPAQVSDLIDIRTVTVRAFPKRNALRTLFARLRIPTASAVAILL